MDVRVGLWRKLSAFFRKHQRIDAFELWCWRRLLRVPWTTRRSNQSSLKEISPKYSLEGLMLKLKLQYFGHLMRRNDSLEKTLMLGKIEGRRKRGWHRMRWLDVISDSMVMSLSKLQERWWKGRPGVLQSMGSQSQIQLSAELTDWEVSEGEDRQRYSYKQSLDNDWSSLVAQTVKNLQCKRPRFRSPGYPLQYSCLENPHGQRSLAGYTVHRVAKSQTQLSD